jgi:predicted component of type VI protein secretion system
VNLELNMPQQTLHDLLEALHAKLHERQHSTAEDRGLIQEVMSDLNRLLRSDATPPTASHTSGLAAQVVRLEAAHPDLVPIIRRIVDMLGKAGV